MSSPFLTPGFGAPPRCFLHGPLHGSVHGHEAVLLFREGESYRCNSVTSCKHFPASTQLSKVP